MDLARLELLGLRVLLVASLIFGAYVGVRGYGHAKYVAGVQAQKNADAVVLAAELTRVRNEEADKRTAVEKAHEQDVQRAQDAAVALAGVNTELGRLRGLLSASRFAGAGPDPSARTGADDPGTLLRLFATCVGRYQAMGSDAKSDADKVTGLQNYVRAAAMSDGRSPVEGGGHRAEVSLTANQLSTAPSGVSSEDRTVHP